jgi:hypothetical protein
MAYDPTTAEAASVIFQASSGPVKLDYDRANTEGRDHDEVFNDFGFVVRAKAKTGEDISMWVFAYRQQSHEVIVAADLCQTLLLQANYSDDEKQTMHDTEFINKGQNLEDYLDPGSLKILESEDSVTWAIAGRELSASPPHWAIRGEHAGVRCDIRLSQRSPGFFHTGRFEELGTDGIAGYQVHGSAVGEIEVDGKLLEIEGYFVHERILMTGKLHSRIANKAGRGSNWMHSWGEEFSWYLLNSDIGSHAVGMVTFGDRQLVVSGSENASIEELDHWLDPKTRQMNPRKWRVRMHTEDGDLDATVTAYGRGYYTWLRRGGTILVHQYVADAEATFTFNDGTVLTSKQLSFNEFMRTFYIQNAVD